ncbi:Uncharacterised protein [uncultured archaeon]|nr:Uncharacterised protein [uncultured archaeon]
MQRCNLVGSIKKITRPSYYWLPVILIIYFISGIEILSDPKESTLFFLMGNIFFSILAVIFNIDFYERNIPETNRWISKNNIIDYGKTTGNKSNISNRLNKIEKCFFNGYQYIPALLVVASRRYISEVWLRPKDTAGIIIIDSITTFLVTLLIISYIGIILYMHMAASNGVKAKYSFEISNSYSSLISLSIENTIKTGLFMALFGSAVIIWALFLRDFNLGMIVNVIIAIPVLFIFIIGTRGIQQGISKSRQYALSELSREMNEISFNYASAAEKNDERSLDIQLKLNTILEILSKRGKDIEELRVRIFEMGQLGDIAITLIVPTLLRFVSEKYLT